VQQKNALNIGPFRIMRCKCHENSTKATGQKAAGFAKEGIRFTRARGGKTIANQAPFKKTPISSAATKLIFPYTKNSEKSNATSEK
jgi:hypothetical protein